jgi:outer membrane protein assembly factor BamB
MRGWAYIAMAAAAFCASACTSGGGVSCSNAGGTQLAATTWPKFRADAANTGRAAVDLNQSTGNGSLVFDGRCNIQNLACLMGETPTQCNTPAGQTCVPIGQVSATPILGLPNPGFSALPQIFVASSDGNVYIVNTAGSSVSLLPNQIFLPSAIVGSPLAGADGNLFVPGNGRLSQFFADGLLKNTAPLSGATSASPNIWGGDEGTVNGTVFIGTESGAFTAVCPNGVNKFSVTFPQTQSTAALVPDPNTPTASPRTPIIVAGGLNGQVRAYTLKGRLYWSFFAASTIIAAVMIDPISNLFYVADTTGHVFAGTLLVNQPSGQLDPDFNFTADAGITASPALGRDSPDVAGRMYVADQNGTLYALDRASGNVLWTFQADGPISASPAVATGGTNDVIVLAADLLGVVDPGTPPVPIGGRVYAIRDDGDRGTALWTFDADHAIGASSPAIGADGTVYIGRQGARRAAGSECTMQSLPSPCLVNDGGALYAIAP